METHEDFYQASVKRGEEKFAKLAIALIEENRWSDLKAACDDKEIRKRLYKEKGIVN